MISPPRERAVSPVVGVVLMVVITVLLASTLTFILFVDMNEQTVDDIVSSDLTEEAGGDDTLQRDLVVAEDTTPGAGDVVHGAVIDVREETAGETLDSITVTYPKELVDLSTSSHDEIRAIGVDTDGNGDSEETFDESDVSGVNVNDGNSRLTVAFDTEYALAADDRVKIRYEGATNPDTAGDYDVSATLNGGQTTEGVLTVG